MAVPDVIRDDSSELVDAVRSGLPYASFVELRDALGLSTEEFVEILGIPRRTLSKRKSEGTFTPAESNAISRVARVYRSALAFFDEGARTSRWLRTPLPALDGASPLQMLDTDPGADLVLDLLRQLAWGIYP